MTNTVATTTGITLAAINASNAATIPDLIGGVAGVALLVWIVIRQTKEIDKLRERNRELADRCKCCELAKSANELLKDAAQDKIDQDHEGENQAHPKEGGSHA